MYCSRKRIFWTATAVILAVVAAFLTWRLMPMSTDSMLRSAVIVEETTWQEITIDGKPCLYFDSARGDSMLIGVTTIRDSALHRSYTTGFWYSHSWLYPSCRGRIATVHTPQYSSLSHATDTLVERLCTESMERELKALGHQKEELDYYMRSHGVQDHGFQQIAALADKVSRAYNGMKRAQNLIDSMRQGKHSIAVRLKSEFVAVYRNEKGRLERVALHIAESDASEPKLAFLQTDDETTPSGATALYRLPFTSRSERSIIAVGFPSIGEPGLECDTVAPQMIPGKELSGGKHDVPSLLAGDGAPAFTMKGRFMGYLKGKNIY